jgi:hypothetical protein
MFSGLSSKKCIQYSTRILKMSYSVSLRGNVIIAHLKAGWAWNDHDRALSEVCSIARQHNQQLAMIVMIDSAIPSGFGEAAKQDRNALPSNLKHVQFVSTRFGINICIKGIMRLCPMPYTWAISNTISDAYESVTHQGYHLDSYRIPA